MRRATLSPSHSHPALQEELGTPALAFVRAVCDALRLDNAVEEEVLELRHNLLRLTHTREFAQAAQFKVLPSPSGCSTLVCFSFTLLHFRFTHINQTRAPAKVHGAA